MRAHLYRENRNLIPRGALRMPVGLRSMWGQDGR